MRVTVCFSPRTCEGLDLFRFAEFVCHEKRLQKVSLDPEIFRICHQPVVFEMSTVPDDLPRENYDFELPDESSWT